MDMIDGLLLSLGKNAILVVIDYLSKYEHFIVVIHSYIVVQIANIFVKEVFKFMACLGQL